MEKQEIHTLWVRDIKDERGHNLKFPTHQTLRRKNKHDGKYNNNNNIVNKWDI